jgi:hypothetical protein
MSGIIEIIQNVVDQEMARYRSCELGVVTAIFPHEAKDDEHNYEVNLRLKHEDLELKKVPLAVPYMGVATLPKIGDLVLVEFVGGDLNQPVVTAMFYHADERPPFHKPDELLFEQRVKDDDKTINHLRFAHDGTIFLQRKVAKLEDNSEALTSLKIDGKTGDVLTTVGKKLSLLLSEIEDKPKVELKVGDKITATVDGVATTVELKVGDKITITFSDADGIKIDAPDQPMDVKVKTLAVEGDTTIKGTVDITGDTSIDGETKITKNTTIDGDLVVGSGPKTTISKNEITGG